MKKQEIARRIARQAGVSRGEAADRLDLMVHQIVSSLRQGKDAPLPGFGKFTHGKDGKVLFEPDGGNPRD